VRPALNVIEDGSPAWVAWPGRWGSTRSLIPPVVGADSPPGPRWHGAWTDPQRFHEEARPAAELGAVAGVGQPAPPRARVEASRRRARALVSYEFPRPKRGAPKPRGLVLSLDGHGDGRPPATHVFRVGAEPGRIEFPLELDPDRPYTVRAVAVAENGFAAAPTAVELPAG
jgi:hypothetical protein